MGTYKYGRKKIYITKNPPGNWNQYFIILSQTPAVGINMKKCQKMFKILDPDRSKFKQVHITSHKLDTVGNTAYICLHGYLFRKIKRRIILCYFSQDFEDRGKKTFFFRNVNLKKITLNTEEPVDGIQLSFNTTQGPYWMKKTSGRITLHLNKIEKFVVYECRFSYHYTKETNYDLKVSVKGFYSSEDYGEDSKIDGKYFRSLDYSFTPKNENFPSKLDIQAELIPREKKIYWNLEI